MAISQDLACDKPERHVSSVAVSLLTHIGKSKKMCEELVFQAGEEWVRMTRMLLFVYVMHFFALMRVRCAHSRDALNVFSILFAYFTTFLRFIVS